MVSGALAQNWSSESFIDIFPYFFPIQIKNQEKRSLGKRAWVLAHLCSRFWEVFCRCLWQTWTQNGHTSLLFFNFHHHRLFWSDRWKEWPIPTSLTPEESFSLKTQESIPTQKFTSSSCDKPINEMKYYFVDLLRKENFRLGFHPELN